MNYIETLEVATINVSSIGDNTIIAAPGAGKYLAIDFLQFVASGSTTVQMKNGLNNYGGPLPLVSGSAVTIENAIHNEHGILTMDDNAAFTLNQSAAVQLGGIIRYRIINK